MHKHADWLNKQADVPLHARSYSSFCEQRHEEASGSGMQQGLFTCPCYDCIFQHTNAGLVHMQTGMQQTLVDCLAGKHMHG